MRRIRVQSWLLSLILVLVAPSLRQVHCEESEYALIQIDFFQPDVDHLTKGYAQSQWGVDLFAYPYAVTQGYFLDGNELLNIVTFFSDYAFDRLIYSEPWGNDPNWIRGYGGVGSGLGQFFSPSGILTYNRPNDNTGYYYTYVTDTWNNRIISFTYDWSSEQISGTSEITGNGLFLPKAIDINNGGDFGDPGNDRIWVANGDRTIKKFDINGNLLLTYAGDGHFRGDLAGIACGRSYFTDPSPPYQSFANNNDIYVIAGNTLLQFREVSPGNIEFRRLHRQAVPVGWFLYLTSVDTDNFGHVWVTEVREESGTGHQASYIRKYTSDLDEICTFYGEGTLNRPQCFSNTGGNRGCGNSLLLEEWDDESGALNYVIGTDILNLATGSNEEHSYHFVGYRLIDPSWVWVKVYDEAEALIKTVADSVPEFTGWSQHLWDGTDQNSQVAPSGNYRIEVTAASSYGHVSTGEPINTVVKYDWVYHINYEEEMDTPAITSIEALDTSLCVYWDDNNNNELGYIIQRKDVTNHEWTVIDTTTWDTESYTDYQVMGSETYYYRIKAYNYFGSTDYSDSSSMKARPHPPTNLFVENFYCNRPYRRANCTLIGKANASPPAIGMFKFAQKPDCESPYPDSTLSDCSTIYADNPANQKPGTFAKVEVWSKSCHWYDHNVVKRESTFVNLDRPMFIHTPPDTFYCTDWTYYFMVRTIDIYGDTSIFVPDIWSWPYACCVGPCHVDIECGPPVFKFETPHVFSLEQNHPNPFNPETQIAYALPQPTRVKLVIYNVLGQKVRTLVDEYQTAGNKTVKWDGKDDSGHEVASGIYFYRLLAGEYIKSRKMVMLK